MILTPINSRVAVGKLPVNKHLMN